MDTTEKVFFNTALPAAQGGHALVLRDVHNDIHAREMLIQNMAALKAGNNLGAMVLEGGPELQLLVQAYQDGNLAKIGDPDAIIEKAMVDGAAPQNEAAARKQAALISEALKQGIGVVFVDARQSLPLGEKPLVDGKSQTYPPESTEGIIDKLYQENPAYQEDIGRINTAVALMKRHGIPSDVIAANLATMQVDPKQNMVMIYGAAHIGGIASKEGATADVQGIVDEGVEAAGWKVTDALIADSKTAQLAGYMVRNPPGGALSCSSRDSLDVLFLTGDAVMPRMLAIAESQKEMITQARQSQIPVVTLSDEAQGHFSCRDVPPAEELYPFDVLHPGQNAEIFRALEAIRLAVGNYGGGGESSASRPTAEPLSNGRGR